MEENENWAVILPKIEQCRTELHQMIDNAFNKLVLSLVENEAVHDMKNGDCLILPLAASPAVFKGTKPTAVFLPDRSEVPVRTWKNAAQVILQDCCADPQRKERLMELRGRVAGNFRFLIHDRPDGLSVPLKICDDLYLESKFDTEALLRNITNKLLDRVGYDYRGIVIQYREPQQAVDVKEAADLDKVELQGPGMTMTM